MTNEREIQEFKKMWKGFTCDIVITPVDTWPTLNYNSYSSFDNFNSRVPCAELWFKMIINYLGEVLLCCYDWNRENIIGNLRYQTVEDVWNSSYMKDKRKEHANGGAITNLCQNCTRQASEEDEYSYLPEFLDFHPRRP